MRGGIAECTRKGRSSKLSGSLKGTASRPPPPPGPRQDEARHSILIIATPTRKLTPHTLGAFLVLSFPSAPSGSFSLTLCPCWLEHGGRALVPRMGWPQRYYMLVSAMRMVGDLPSSPNPPTKQGHFPPSELNYGPVMRPLLRMRGVCVCGD